MLNQVALIGRVTHDPEEPRKSSSDNSVLNFTIAVDNFDKESAPNFIPVVVFGNVADFISNYVRKGDLLSVEGRIQQRNYTNKEGKTISVVEVIASSINLLESKSTRENRNKVSQ